nr:zinc ribbon domain-containing protein [uncultured Clostridium sp.]
MAIIICPECGKEISDKAEKCVYCGKALVKESVKEGMRCLECGTVLSETDEICPSCGGPVENKVIDSDSKPQQVEVAGIKVEKKTKNIIIGIVIAIMICFAGGAGYKVYSDNKAKQEYQEAYNTYIDNLKTAQIFMLEGGSDAESLCNLTLKVWGNSIYEENDSETDKYTRHSDGTGDFYDDFNTAIYKLYDAQETKDTISKINSSQSSVKEIMKKLQDSPEGLDKCYDTVSDLYEDYKTLTDLALSPSGNYSGFSDNKNNAVSGFMTAYDKLDSQIPEKKGE